MVCRLRAENIASRNRLSQATLASETAWDQEEAADYLDYLADFRAEFHDLRPSDRHEKNSRNDFAGALSPNSYAASQALAAELLNMGSAGIVYPSVRRGGGTCIACFRRCWSPTFAWAQPSHSSLRIRALRQKYTALDSHPSHAFPNGSSSDGLCGVNSSAPFSVMCMSSSSRTPNSPRI